MSHTIRYGSKMPDLSSPLVMGIVNVTPDSFFDGGKYNSLNAIKAKIEKHLSEGADIIDVGAYSSRPGAENISAEEEFNRFIPVVQLIKNEFKDVILSFDTFRSEVVKRLYDKIGSFIVNDISGGLLDNMMHKVTGDLQLPYILMHMRGTPQSMQSETVYKNLIPEVIKELAVQTDKALQNGVNDIIIDPGIGFSKTTEQNFSIIKHLKDFAILDKPILVGLSRKSIISKTLDISTSESLNGTSVLNTVSVLNGAKILRVHDVREAKEVIELLGYVKKS